MKRVRMLVLCGLVVILFASVAAAAQIREAPMLAERVAKGELPPVEERIPQEPFVEHPLEEIGRYGGSIRRVYIGVSDWQNLNYMGVRNEPLVFVSQDGTVKPNLLEGWEYLEDGQVLRIYLRKGIKWSDGYPFTVDDIIYDLETRVNGNMPLEVAGLGAKVKVSEITRIDDYTADLPLKEKYPIEFIATFESPVSPKHYLSKFDPRYDSTKTWQDLAQAWSSQSNTEALVELPQLSAWKVVEVIPRSRIVAERNPYFWKVDPEGNQLPYVDKIEFKYVAGTDTIPALVQAGEIDLQVRHLLFADYPFYKQHEAAGNYRTAALQATSLGPCIRLNYAVEDTDFQQLFRNMDFRVALSLGIDREALSNSLYFGLVEPWGVCAIANTPSFPGDEYAQLYTDYDPDQANALLDGLGLKDTNRDGIREINGKPLTIVIDAEKGYGSGPVKGLELIAAQWRKIGVNAVINVIERSLMLARWQDNSYTAYAWKLDGGIDPVWFNYAWAILSPPEYLWHNSGVPMQKWIATEGAEGVEPPEFIKEINRRMQKATTTLDPQARADLGKELAKYHAENLFVIPTTTYVEVGVVNKKLANVPKTWLAGNELVGEKSLRPWQMFYKD